MSNLPTLDWQPADDGGWEADIGVLWFRIDSDGPDFPGDTTLTIGWHDGDPVIEMCDSIENAKHVAIELGTRILQQGIEALKRGDKRPLCRDNSPPWFAGRIRDWHRGHGCQNDDGRPRTPEGAAEIERGGK